MGNVCFEIEERKLTAIVDAYCRGDPIIGSPLFRPHESCVRSNVLDGEDISEINIRRFWRCIGVIDQDPAVLGYTIFENVTMGVIRAIRYACDTRNIETGLFKMTGIVERVRESCLVLD